MKKETLDVVFIIYLVVFIIFIGLFLIINCPIFECYGFFDWLAFGIFFVLMLLGGVGLFAKRRQLIKKSIPKE